ncbi:glycosyltransferase family 2 protein [Pseudomonas eucalypticola]|uniref:Glycosyltransferase family 2 protein n=1 Tax=Pseudomonas eucalypticola TaxID=2599595 RepID=A0A7D5D8F4_9PSED|nr:glycosyltransferase family 2 protein [Pseudomonas eucalypticola]QKZ06174.1 glycosyltransferase family 2 protein [Pseudomonas eucalypticola]
MTSNIAEVAVLLCTFNGEQFLDEQLRSIVQQTHPRWTLYVSDDGSTDATLAILRAYQQRLGAERLVIMNGPRGGFGKNFMSLVGNKSLAADYYAFCDQDDLWFPDKLERGIRALEALPAAEPGLYCSRTRLIDEQRRHIGYSPLFNRSPSFSNALVQSIAGANTMLINDAARNLLCLVDESAPIVAHDWLTYMIVCGCGGTTIFDPTPSIDYRQHSGNLIGANSSIRQRLERLGKMLTGRFSHWSEQNIVALGNIRPFLSPASAHILQQFETARRSPLARRICLMQKAGVYRQTLQGNITLLIAATLNKI